MNDLPAPLTPPDCDLRGYDFMPLYGHRLFSSELYTESTDAEFRAAIRLWWSAWNQVPAASLPSSDQALATLADYGRDLKGWSKVKKRALHGFVLCSDGRLYHRILAPEAVDSYEKRLVSQKRRDADRDRLKAWRESRLKRVSRGDGNTKETTDETEVKRVSKCVDSDRDNDSDNTVLLPSVVEAPQEKKSKRATRLPEDWLPSLDERVYATGKGFAPQAITLMAEKFRNYWVAKGGNAATKLDWSATWRNWVLAEKERQPGNARSGPAELQARWGLDGYDLAENAATMSEEILK